jgi:hypothetical protein
LARAEPYRASVEAPLIAYEADLIFQQRILDRPQLSVFRQQIVERLNGERARKAFGFGSFRGTVTTALH